MSLYIEMATRAAALITPAFSADTHAPRVENLNILAPLGLDTRRTIQVTLERQQQGGGGRGRELLWDLAITSFPENKETPGKTRHASAVLDLVPLKDQKVKSSLERYEHLIGYERCNTLLAYPASAAIQGPPVYRLFDKVFNYSSPYRGVQKISSTGRSIAGLVHLPLVSGREHDEMGASSLVNGQPPGHRQLHSLKSQVST